MIYPRPVLLVHLLLSSLACGATDRHATGSPLFSDPSSIEVLAEQRNLDGPTSDAPNRFYQGWIPVEMAGRTAYRSAPERATILLVSATPGSRTLAIELAMEEELLRTSHVNVRVGQAEPLLVPVSNPLSIPLPEDLPPGRHRVEISPGGAGVAPLVALAAVVRPVADRGSAHIEDEDMLQTGPSLVDVVAEPEPGWSLTGRLCPASVLARPRGYSVTITSIEDVEVARWSGPGGVHRWLPGCRKVALPPIPVGGPVRVRFEAAADGSDAVWRSWRWLSPEPGSPDLKRDPVICESTRPRAPRLVVLYMMDALRADAPGHLGGPPGVSPTIDRLAREGFTFRDHRATAPNTLLSIRHLFTGQLLVNREAWLRMGVNLPRLAQEFQAAGYLTGLFSGNGYVSATFGLAEGFDHISREALFEGSGDKSLEVNRNAARVHAAALDWLDTLPPDQNVFLYLHTIHPHNPYAPPADLDRRFTAGIPSKIQGDTATLRAITRGRLSTSEADRARLRGLYYASVAYNDSELGRLLGAIEKRFPRRESFLVLTSDHGEELFDHGGALHGYTLYEEQLRVPLVAWAPEFVVPGESHEVTDALDLHATLVGLARPQGIANPGGRCLLELLEARSSSLPQALHFSVSDGISGGAYALRFERWKYIWVHGTATRWAMGLGPARSWDREYLFDLQLDPSESTNLAGFGTIREQWLRTRLRSWLLEHLGQVFEEDRKAPPESLDEHELRRLRALGYID